MQVFITYDGKTYEWDRDYSVSESATIKAHLGLHVGEIEAALGDPEHEKWVDALRAIMWILKKRNGEIVDPTSIDFKITSFYNALAEGLQKAAENAEVSESPKAPK